MLLLKVNMAVFDKDMIQNTAHDSGLVSMNKRKTILGEKETSYSKFYVFLMDL